MFDLILVFGVWINPYQVTHLDKNPLFDACHVHFAGDKYKGIKFNDKTCEEVIKEIKDKVG